MKKVKFFGLAGIILLASGAGFSSCSSDSADPTGGTGVAGQVVKTQFYLNIPYAGNEKGGNARVSTRMSDVNTQHTSDMATNFGISRYGNVCILGDSFFRSNIYQNYQNWS